MTKLSSLHMNTHDVVAELDWILLLAEKARRTIIKELSITPNDGFEGVWDDVREIAAIARRLKTDIQL